MASEYTGNAACLNWQNCSTNVPTGSDKLVGWVPENSGRGTLSLLWTCLLTTFLCTWVVIHPRIDKCKRLRVLHKIALSAKTIIAPELIAVEGAQEWTQARRIVKSCEQLAQGELGLVEAFYIGMLGIRYRTSRGTRILWPNQFVWLMQQGLFQWKDKEPWRLQRSDIRDRSNADGTAKFFALVQVAWFVVSCLIRLSREMELAPLECMTLSYIPLLVLTYFFWWLKPKDIHTPSEIDLPAMSQEQWRSFESLTISDDFDEESEVHGRSALSVFYLTPRVFEKEARDRRLRQAINAGTEHVQYRKARGLPLIARAKPLPAMAADDIILAHWDPGLYRSRLWPITCLFGISFPALHLISWNGTFPTTVELWMWRATAITSIVGMLWFMQYEMVVFKWKNPSSYFRVLAPLLYVVSRVVMLGVAMAAFRASNPAVYETFVISNYWLHLA